MVLYFSGTGNSQFVAYQMAERMDDHEIISIHQLLKEGKNTVIQSKRPLVFVTPTYGWRMPRVVERWILETSFQGCQDAYFVLTCGGSCGNAGVYLEKLCAKKNLRFCGLAPVVMPENYLALFPTPSPAECQAIVENAKPVIDAVAEQIRAGNCLETASTSLIDKLESGPINPLFYALFVHDKGFRVTEQCVSCGKCADRCALNNIKMVDGKPNWMGKCTHCMACIAGCPTAAIEYQSATKGRHRHYMMKEWKSRETGGQGI